MVKLYREKVSPQADVIEADLQEMIFGYDREITDPAAASQRFGPERSLPVITNNEKIVSGVELPAYLLELRTLMVDWQAFQSDCCFVDDNGEVI
jgi:hypothetical protein